MQAVILAAGRGTRLGAKAEGLPKCLLQVGGKPLLEHQLRALADIGGGPALVVVGYAADLVREAVGDRAETIFNARYDRTNSLYSLWLAREWIKGPVIVMNSDLLCDRELYDLLARAGPDHLAYDSTSGKSAEQMKVRIENGLVCDLSKEMPNDRSSGENVGMVYLGERAARAVLAKAGELVAQEGGDNAFWVRALRETLKDVPLRGVNVACIPWVEIDTPYDLHRARQQVWPQIMDRTATVLKRRRRTYRAKLAFAGAAVAALMTAAWLLAAATSVRTWEPVRPETGRPVTVVVDKLSQEWHELRAAETLSARVVGPRALRVDARAVVPPGTRERAPYVVELLLDGKRADWHKFSATPDAGARFEGGTVCDRDKIDVALPAGEHTCGVRLVAGDASALLVRFRVLETRP